MALSQLQHSDRTLAGQPGVATEGSRLLDPGAAKFDQGKLRVDLIPIRPLEDLAAVYTFGAGKYADNNWRKGIAWMRIYGAILRHLWKWAKGIDLDEESGLPHLAHAAWSCFTLLEYRHTHPEMDDRTKESVKAI